jgi:hypothetical protein
MIQDKYFNWDFVYATDVLWRVIVSLNFFLNLIKISNLNMHNSIKITVNINMLLNNLICCTKDVNIYLIDYLKG